MRRWGRLAVAGFGIVSVEARSGRACGHRCETELPLLVSPVAGESGVPTNVVVTLRWEAPPAGGPAPLVTIWRARDAAEVPVTIEQAEFANPDVTVLRLRPNEPLEPLERYEVFRTNGESVATFVTGEDADVTAPEAPLVALTAGSVEQCRSDLDICCYESPVRRIFFDVDHPERVTFHVEGPNGRAASDLDPFGPAMTGLVLDGPQLFDCKRENRHFVLGPPGDFPVRVSVRDRSGNESSATEVVVYAGVTSSQGGCGCAVASRSEASPLSWALVMLPFAARFRARCR